jgi:ribosomal-protein-alanine N-acetyltransferase
MKNCVKIRSRPFYLRPLLESDLEEIYAIWTNPAVRKYLFDDVIIPIERAASEIHESTLSFEKSQYGLWAVFLQDAPEMIGFTGYRHFFDPPQLQLLYG